MFDEIWAGKGSKKGSKGAAKNDQEIGEFLPCEQITIFNVKRIPKEPQRNSKHILQGTQKELRKEPKRNTTKNPNATPKGTQTEPKRNPKGIQKVIHKEPQHNTTKEPKANPKGSQKESKRHPTGTSNRTQKGRLEKI